MLVEIVGVVATITVVAMELGPAPAVWRIYESKSTGVTPLIPLIALGTNGWMWSMYGYLEGNIFPVALSNFIGFVLSIVYTHVFFRYTTNKAYAIKILALFGLLFSSITIYAVAGAMGYTYQSIEQVKNRVGYAGVATVFLLFSSPFENIALVFRLRSAAYIPIQLVLAGALNSAMWSFYSLLTSDWFIFVPNFGALLIGLVQIALYFKFYPLRQPEAERFPLRETENALDAELISLKEVEKNELEDAEVISLKEAENELEDLVMVSPGLATPTTYGSGVV